jgi:hypothetical protein
MKRILLVLAIVALALPAVRQMQAQTDVSIDFFYNNLNDGNWIEVGDYGYCWQPNVAVSNADWRPYADGYWAYTDVGWTWVSYEDFGGVTYHYGRWARLADQGWVWVPGYEWGPAWVSWRTGGDYVGWAPLPPGEAIYEGRAITGQVDVEFDIGPMYYNFVDVRYIGEPVLRDRIFAASQNITYVNQTVNVTNITYSNSTVYNYGPDYNRLSQYSTRPIQRLTLQRETNVNLSGGIRANEITKVQGNKLVVAAPMKVAKPANPIAPKIVKARIAQPKLEHGWAGISDPKAKAELQQKMKTENAKEIPPPTIQPKAAGAGPTGASPAATAAGAGSATPASTAAPAMSPATGAEKGKGKGRRGEQPFATPSASASAAGQPTPAERGKGHKGKPGEEAMPTPAGIHEKATPGAMEQPNSSERGKNHKGRHGEEPASTPKAETPNATEQNNAAGVAPEGTQPPSKHRGERGRNETAPTPSQGGQLSNESEKGKHEGRNELAPTGPSTNAEVRKGPRNAPQGRVQAEPPAGAGKKEGGQPKKKGGEASPSPVPQ